MVTELRLEQKGRRYTLTLTEDRIRITEGKYTHAVMLDMPRSRLRGVGISGSAKGAVLALYVGKKRLSYRLGMNYTMEELDGAFGDIPRFRAPRHTQSMGNGDWRSEEQLEDMRIPMMLLARGLQAAGFGLGVVSLFAPRSRWLVGGMAALLTVCIWAYVTFPAWFTVIPEKERKKEGVRAKVYSITVPFAVYALFTLFDWRLFGMVWQWGPMVRWGCLAAAAGGGLAWGLWKYQRECREHWDYACFMGIGLSLILLWNTCQINHALSRQEPEQVMATVLYTASHSRTRGRRWHSCRVQLEGEELEFRVRRADCEELKTGDRIPILYNEGGLGIAYGWLDSEAWNAMKGT